LGFLERQKKFIREKEEWVQQELISERQAMGKPEINPVCLKLKF
jgi:hypothetical protein